MEKRRREDAPVPRWSGCGSCGKWSAAAPRSTRREAERHPSPHPSCRRPESSRAGAPLTGCPQSRSGCGGGSIDYAYRNGYLITRLPQRLEDFLSHFDSSRPDFVSRALLALLADERGFLKGSPYHLSFVDTLDALRESAGRLLGRRRRVGHRRTRRSEILAELRAREPFAVEFFSVFTQPYDMLRKSLEYLGKGIPRPHSGAGLGPRPRGEGRLPAHRHYRRGGTGEARPRSSTLPGT